MPAAAITKDNVIAQLSGNPSRCAQLEILIMDEYCGMRTGMARQRNMIGGGGGGGVYLEGWRIRQKMSREGRVNQGGGKRRFPNRYKLYSKKSRVEQVLSGQEESEPKSRTEKREGDRRQEPRSRFGPS